MVLKSDSVDMASSDPTLHAVDSIIEIPADVQHASDAVMAYLGDNALRPQVKLCGSPLTVLSGLMSHVYSTVPQDLEPQSKTFMAFISRQITHFCREKNVNHLTLSFDFKRG